MSGSSRFSAEGGRQARPVDDIERAHLRDPADRSFTIYRAGPPADLADLVRRFWIPVWHCPPDRPSMQQVLQYPICLVVVADGYARFYGVVTGLSSTVLQGDGWAVGAMLQPAAGALLTGRSVAELTDRFVDLEQVAGLDGAGLTRQVRQLMTPDPHHPQAQQAACDLLCGQLRRHLPVDPEGLLINAVVDAVESDPELRSVSQLCTRFALTERTLQRLTRRRLGLSPRWLILRRRLHEAAGRMREPGAELAAVAADLGYADQTHFTRDFRRVTGMTPGRFVARYRTGPVRGSATDEACRQR